MSNELGKFLEELRGKLSLRDAAEKSGLSHTYIRDLELGVNRKTKAPIRPSADTLKQLADAYNYPVSELLKKAGYLEDENGVSNKDEIDIAKRMEQFRKDLSKDGGLLFNGEPMSEEAIESLMDAMELIARQTQRINKKYIPKKYRNEDNN
jgi:HTH-type transcriptional regulator, competence development regulator